MERPTVPPKDKVQCPRCGGTGTVLDPRETGTTYIAKADQCPLCKGKRWVAPEVYAEHMRARET